MCDVSFFLHPASGSFRQLAAEIVLLNPSVVTGSLNTSLWSQITEHKASLHVACYHSQEAKFHVSMPRKALGRVPGVDLEAWNWRSEVIGYIGNADPLSSNSKCKTRFFSFRFNLGVKLLADMTIKFGFIKLCFSWLNVLMYAPGW